MLIECGRLVGAVWVLLALLAGVLLGGLVIRRAGASAWRRTRERLARGLTPSQEAADTTVILLAGLLLVFPGFVTDLAALLLLVPGTRSVARRPLERALSRVVVTMPRTDGEVVRGEIVDQ